MSRRVGSLFALMLALGAGAALREGQVLYVRAKNANMKASPAPIADTVAVLQPGVEVTYLKPAQGARGWHQVSALGVKGFMYQASLSLERPHDEISGAQGDRAVSPQEFASSGAATKALGEGAVRYGTDKDLGRAVTDIQHAEDLAKAVPDSELVAHARQAHLHPALGLAAGGAP
jgi:hypothetical protein